MNAMFQFSTDKMLHEREFDIVLLFASLNYLLSFRRRHVFTIFAILVYILHMSNYKPTILTRKQAEKHERLF